MALAANYIKGLSKDQASFETHKESGDFDKIEPHVSNMMANRRPLRDEPEIRGQQTGPELNPELAYQGFDVTPEPDSLNETKGPMAQLAGFEPKIQTRSKSATKSSSQNGGQTPKRQYNKNKK